MTVSRAPSHIWMFEDLLELPDDGNRYEIFDGNLLVTPPPQFAHVVTQGALMRILLTQARPDLIVLDGGAGVIVRGGSTYYIPDLVVVDAAAVGRTRHSLDVSDVRLAVEVLSPSTRRRDQGLKRADYAAAGIPDYWIVDRERRTLTVLTLDPGETAYREETVVEAGFPWQSTRPFEVSLDPGDFC